MNISIHCVNAITATLHHDGDVHLLNLTVSNDLGETCTIICTTIDTPDALNFEIKEVDDGE